MPCYVTGSLAGDRLLEIEETRLELTKLTRIACKLAKELEAHNIKMPKGTQTWWTKHKKIDRKGLT